MSNKNDEDGFLKGAGVVFLVILGIVFWALWGMSGCDPMWGRAPWQP